MEDLRRDNPELFKQRLEFIQNKDNEEKLKELKKNYTFHARKFEDDMEPWFDLWMRKIK